MAKDSAARVELGRSFHHQGTSRYIRESDFVLFYFILFILQWCFSQIDYKSILKLQIVINILDFAHLLASAAPPFNSHWLIQFQDRPAVSCFPITRLVRTTCRSTALWQMAPPSSPLPWYWQATVPFCERRLADGAGCQGLVLHSPFCDCRVPWNLNGWTFSHLRKKNILCKPLLGDSMVLKAWFSHRHHFNGTVNIHGVSWNLWSAVLQRSAYIFNAVFCLYVADLSTMFRCQFIFP